jgi:hypothetical protein
MVLSLKVIGYYEHCNFGDDQYKISFQTLFQEYIQQDYTLDFYDCDKIYQEPFIDTDVIIIGGGDILNPYFLNKINAKFINKTNKIIALSVGLPYTETLVQQTSKLNIIDYIFIRTTQDLKIFNKYFSQDRVFYLPDVSYILSDNYIFTKRISTKEPDIKSYSAFLKTYTKQITNQSSIEYNQYNDKIKQIKQNKRVMGICLSRHFYNKNFITEFEKVKSGIIEFIKWALQNDYGIVFIPFNTNLINSNENDIIMANEIINDVFINNNQIINIDIAISNDEMNETMKLLDICIPMRFHSVLYCIYNMVPFVSVYSTRKIHNLLLEIDWKWMYKLPVNENFVPIEFNSFNIQDQILNLDKQNEFQQNIYKKLLHINTNLFGKMFFNNVKRFIDVILCKKRYKSIDIEPINIDKIIQSLFETITDFADSRGFSNYREITDDNLKNVITSIISYHLTESVDSEYNYGMKEKIFDTSKEYDYIKEWKWIINHHVNKDRRVLQSNDKGLFNIEYIDQNDYSGAHRSGWQYVYKHIEHLHNANSEILLDLYIDRSFHWNSDVNKVLQILPYKKSWIGFVHHTFDTSFSNYNCHNLLDSYEFIESLKYCRGIFVLSKYLKQQFENELQSRNLSHIQVYALVHPTDTNVKCFSYNAFYNNPNKRLVHIGGWLRNVYSFYNISLPEMTTFKYGLLFGNKTNIVYKTKNDKIDKIALKGKNMNNYYPLENIIENIKCSLQYSELTQNCSTQNCSTQNCSTQNCSTQNCSTQNCSTQNCSTQNCSTQNPNGNCLGNNELYNNWSKHFYDDIVEKVSSIRFLEYLNNDEYDKLMTENIVYINLVDASAVNTIIECIVRNTPIIVNKHPSVVELLGEKYPLYFTASSTNYNLINVQVYNMLCSDSLIRRSHRYLKRMDKSRFHIKSFVTEFKKYLQDIYSKI